MLRAKVVSLGVSLVVLCGLGLSTANATDPCDVETEISKVSVEASPSNSCVHVALGTAVGCSGEAEIVIENTCEVDIKMKLASLDGYRDGNTNVRTIRAGESVYDLVYPPEPLRETEYVVNALYRAEVDGESHEIAVQFTSTVLFREYDGCSVSRSSLGESGGPAGAWSLCLLGVVVCGVRRRRNVEF